MDYTFNYLTIGKYHSVSFLHIFKLFLTEGNQCVNMTLGMVQVWERYGQM